MPVVLAYRVLESELGPIEHLRPNKRVTWIGENPALVVAWSRSRIPRNERPRRDQFAWFHPSGEVLRGLAR